MTCQLPKRLARIHFEISLLEEARSRLAAHRGELLDRPSLIVEHLIKLRGERAPGDTPNKESLALLLELKGIMGKMKENTREGEWLEIQSAAKRQALATAQLLHVVVSI